MSERLSDLTLRWNLKVKLFQHGHECYKGPGLSLEMVASLLSHFTIDFYAEIMVIEILL